MKKSVLILTILFTTTCLFAQNVMTLRQCIDRAITGNLFSDGGYASKSWKEMILPGISLNKKEQFASLQWIRDMSMQDNCVESLANHDPDVHPHLIVL